MGLALGSVSILARVEVRGNPEEMAFFFGHKLPEVGAQGGIKIILYRYDFFFFQKLHQALGRAFREFLIGLGAFGKGQGRQVAVAVFLQLQSGPGARELALEEHDLILPGQGDEVDVLLVPGILFFSNP
jgi:hypothetical protein